MLSFDSLCIWLFYLRFRTFVCDSEKKRVQAFGVGRMEDDSRASTPEVVTVFVSINVLIIFRTIKIQ